MHCTRSSGPPSSASSSHLPACLSTIFGWRGSDGTRPLRDSRAHRRGHADIDSFGGGMPRLTLLFAAVALLGGVPCMASDRTEAPPGPVKLTVRLPNPGQKILDVEETMPVRPGSLTLYYPKWIPGDHSPDGPIDGMMGLEITAGGKPIPWRRDEVDMFAFHLAVPSRVDRIEVRFQFPARERVTPTLMGVEWNAVALYYAGYPTREE